MLWSFIMPFYTVIYCNLLEVFNLFDEDIILLLSNHFEKIGLFLKMFNDVAVSQITMNLLKGMGIGRNKMDVHLQIHTTLSCFNLRSINKVWRPEMSERLCINYR